jgi:DinB superfamily
VPTPSDDDQLVRYTDATYERPLPATLRVARLDLLAAIDDMRRVSDASLTQPWAWKGGSEEELRYGFYRISESFELAGIEADANLRGTGKPRGRATDLIAPATAARWDLQGLLIGLDDEAWDADPGGGGWTIRQTLGHIIEGQRYYGVGTAWWQEQGYEPDDANLPPVTPDAAYEGLPDEEAEAAGSPSEVRERLDVVLDRAAERLAGLPDDRLAVGARWSGFAIDIGFRFGRWSSHIREHTVQVEKTMVMLDRSPSEVDRLVRLILAAWGRAETSVYGAIEGGAATEILANAAARARTTATELAGLATS